MTWHDGNPVDGGYADIGLENIRGHTGHEKPSKRVSDQAKELGLYLVGLEL